MPSRKNYVILPETRTKVLPAEVVLNLTAEFILGLFVHAINFYNYLHNTNGHDVYLYGMIAQYFYFFSYLQNFVLIKFITTLPIMRLSGYKVPKITILNWGG